MISYLHKMLSKIKEEKGESLVMVMVAVGIVGILSMVFATMQTNNQRMMKKTQLASEMVEIRNMFSSKMPCVAKSCAEFKNMVDNYRIGSWHFLATCEKNEVYIQTRKYTSDHKEPIKDPVHVKRAMDWKPLFTAAGNGFYCTLTIIDSKGNQDEGSSSGSTNGNGLDKVLKGMCPAGKSPVVDPDTLNVVCQ